MNRDELAEKILIAGFDARDAYDRVDAFFAEKARRADSRHDDSRHDDDLIRAWVTRDAGGHEGSCDLRVGKAPRPIDGGLWPRTSLRDLAALLLPPDAYGADAICEIEIRKVVKR